MQSKVYTGPVRKVQRKSEYKDSHKAWNKHRKALLNQGYSCQANNILSTTYFKVQDGVRYEIFVLKGFINKGC